ncbi:hypothetical protein Q9L58_010570, partial [Maublancomyces gigas]
MSAAVKDRALLTWLKTAATHSLPPTDFGTLQIAHASAHAESKEELPTWAWTEYQVIHDNHAATTKAPRLFRKLPSIFESAQLRNARKLKTIERSLFPVSGPLGELINPTPAPAPNPTMPDPSPREPLAENIPISSPETNEEMKEAEDDTPVWPTAETLTRPGEHDKHAPPPSPPEPAPAPAETAIELTPCPSDSAPAPTPTPTPTATFPTNVKGGTSKRSSAQS